jgi:hypothetical protein
VLNYYFSPNYGHFAPNFLSTDRCSEQATILWSFNINGVCKSKVENNVFGFRDSKYFRLNITFGKTFLPALELCGSKGASPPAHFCMFCVFS